MCSGDRQSQGQEWSVSEGESNGLQTVNLPTRGYGHAKEPWYIETPYRDELMPANRSKRVDNLQDAKLANRFIRHFRGYCFSKILEAALWSHCPDGLGEPLALVLVGLRGLSHNVLGTVMMDDRCMVR